MTAKILVVDDDPGIIDLLVRILTRDGYTPLIARNGVEALAQVEREPPDLILLDVTMPLLDGFAVCKRLKDNEATALIPVTMLTGLDDRDNRQRGLEVGTDDFLTKPFDTSLLRARIISQLRLKRMTDQLERTEQVVFMLALAVEAKDSYTEGHLRRLASYSEQLAIAAHVPAAQLKAIRFGGLLHDIGKIGVEDAILRKPEPLTPEEYEQIKLHPEHGARIIQPMRFAADVMPIIRHHHERWDGQGYPAGICGEQIPLGARIVSVVDAYDAMMTDRPYRRSLGLKEALQRLHAGRGIQWDPQLVDLFITMVKEGQLKEPSMAHGLLEAQV
ncbi:HD-GYP domain-containing protein [Candidatus Viridilinea mediisalina]|uniref:Two-component system response regulator n=1 Tax=Candidatus Viridilinea mediisalina TaxID=2024553 RepID=A0A2A6RHS0_9CHLR|nr:HD domain-containing phosphohydrolase [Candidatus Viridilinea mediisalina]PDW02483.1 two-component system response regulator [Candidatus Viridilinea mediisalina]